MDRLSRSVLLVHGDFGDGQESWTKTVEEIGTRAHSVIADRPGFGETIASDAHFSIGGDADYLLRAAGDAGLDSFHLVGHSYGALVALEMTIRQPGRVISLHLIEPPFLDVLPEDPIVRQLDRSVREIQEGHRRIGDEATTAAFFSTIGAGDVIEGLRGSPAWQRLCRHAHRFGTSEPAGDYPNGVLEHLPADLPIALYTGGRSHPALRAIGFAVAARLAGARLVDVPTAGHAVQTASAAFVDPLLALMKEAETAGGSRLSAPPADTARK